MISELLALFRSVEPLIVIQTNFLITRIAHDEITECVSCELSCIQMNRSHVQQRQ
jgi:hypothetical protein